MEDAHPLESRPPTIRDLIHLCALLNERATKYVVIGRIAMIDHGSSRTTADIDILIESSRKNQLRVRRTIQHLPDSAVDEMDDDDFEIYAIVRIADEFVVDGMLTAAGVSFEDAGEEIEFDEYLGVRIPFASKALMIRLKHTMRRRGALDRVFLVSSHSR
jgi:hypothetical protein